MADKEIFKPAFSDIAAVKDLFNSPGWAKYEERVRELRDFEQSRIDAMTDGSRTVSDKDLFTLNVYVARKSLFNALLLVKEEMLDEVDPDRENQEENKGFATSKAE